MKLSRHLLVLAAAAATALTGCGKSDTATAVAPLSITQGTSCSLDGMLLADYPGPKAQIHYAGQAEPDFFCDTVEMFHTYLNPEQIRAVEGLVRAGHRGAPTGMNRVITGSTPGLPSTFMAANGTAPWDRRSPASRRNRMP